MKKLSMQIGTGVLALTLATGAAFAGHHKLNGTGATTHPTEARGEMRKKIIEKFDKDGDGKLNDEERAAAKEAMKEHRQKGDGDLRKKIVEKFDKDGDGKLNDEEKAAAKEAVKAHREKHGASTKPSE